LIAATRFSKNILLKMRFGIDAFEKIFKE